ncbi:hypothetical protein [Aquimonas voraii]|uniref:Uncharacterized protein n=1 Tax=Aquimonas voraii TaxID=265719 RepID=A0A1G6XXG1_9GAMM|nr:hypothetical protein [Aquimonas voraii]SDD82878.1 hypothetical protein SAMN04488509_10823 [Aquimonas voraii]
MRDASSVFCALLVAALGYGSNVEAEEFCELGMKSCAAGSYQHVAAGDPCDSSEGLVFGTCRGSAEPPDVAELVCYPVYPRSMDCQVWPQGPNFTYTFVTQGSVLPSISGSTPFPFQSYSCPSPGSSGVMHITVTSPFGVSSNASIPVACTVDAWIQ